MKKTIITILATALACFCLVGTTLAFLVDKTDPIVNTFTAGNVDITLTETGVPEGGGTKSFKMIPGSAIPKDPAVTVTVGSEECWVFVKIEKSENFDDYMTYTPATGWAVVETNTLSVVYSRKVTTAEMGNKISILNGDVVTVKNDVTKAMMDAFTAATNPEPQPTLTFTAYAVQYENLTTVEAAWTQAKALG